MRNETYKHLEDPLRIGRFTVGQWVGLIATLLAAILFARFLSPLPTKPTIAVSILVAFLPWTVAYALDGTDMRVRDTVMAMVRWAHGDKHFLPGGGELVEGYTVAEEAVEARLPARAPEDVALARRQLEGAWEA
jgi:hypothetical protein